MIIFIALLFPQKSYIQGSHRELFSDMILLKWPLEMILDIYTMKISMFNLMFILMFEK